jgi:hypothetical protein
MAVEEADPHGENAVEPAGTEVGVLEGGADELGAPGIDEAPIAASRRVDHARRAVDGHQVPVVQTLADEGRSHAMAAAHLEHHVAWLHGQAFDRQAQALAHHIALQTGCGPSYPSTITTSPVDTGWRIRRAAW